MKAITEPTNPEAVARDPRRASSSDTATEAEGRSLPEGEKTERDGTSKVPTETSELTHWVVLATLPARFGLTFKSGGIALEGDLAGAFPRPTVRDLSSRPSTKALGGNRRLSTRRRNLRQNYKKGPPNFSNWRSARR